MASIDFTQQHHPMMMTCPNIHHTHPFYRQQPFFHPLANTTYRGESEFRPSFYNPFEIKHRRRTSRAQLKVLEKSFLENAKPNASVRRSLAQELDMTPRGVQIWFQNRRAKTKLQNKKSLQQQQVTQHTPSGNNNSTSLPIAPFNSSSLESVSPLFYPVGADLTCQNQTTSSLFMSDQSWLAMPMHPLSYSPSSSSSCSSSSSSSPDKDQGIMNIPLSSSYLPSPTTPMFSSANEALITGLSPCSDGTLYPNHTQQEWPASTQYHSPPLTNYQEQQQQHREFALFDYQYQQSTTTTTHPSACGVYAMDPLPFDYRNC